LLCFFSAGFNFDFLSTSQEIGWEDHLQYGLFNIEWDVKPQLNQSLTVAVAIVYAVRLMNAD